MPTGSCSPSPLTTVSTVPDGVDREHGLRALVGDQQRAVGRDGDRPRVAQRRAAGQQRRGAAAGEVQHAAGAAEPVALVGDRDVAGRARRRRGRDAEAGEGDERGREAAPHAGTASERISAANAATTAGSKFAPAQRSISVDRLGHAQARLVRPLLHHGTERIADRNDAGALRDLVAAPCRRGSPCRPSARGSRAPARRPAAARARR